VFFLYLKGKLSESRPWTEMVVDFFSPYKLIQEQATISILFVNLLVLR